MNTTSVKLNDTTFKEIEGIIQKVAQENNISGVTSVNIKLSKDESQSLVHFDKVAVPQDLAEEMNPQMVTEETGKRVFPHGQLVDIVSDLGVFLEKHKESGMIPDDIMDRLENLHNELSNVWSRLADFAMGEDWFFRKEKERLHELGL